MKLLDRLIYLCITTSFCLTAQAKGLKEIPVDWTSYSEDQIELYLQEQRELEQSSQKENLNLAKASLINGNIRRAQFFLERIHENGPEDSNRLVLIKRHYQALIAFIENRPQESLERLSHQRLEHPSLYPQTCLLKLINMANYPVTDEFEKEMARCQSQTQNFSKNQQFWLDNLLILKNNNTTEIRGTILSAIDFIMSSPGVLRVWLKSGLFFNQEKLILDHLETLSDAVYRSATAREIIALLYYRQNNQEMARDFVEDIDSPNADNIRGNLSLDKKQYELAYGHYKLALQKKQNSLNALERSLPLAWMLSQWEEGVDLLDSLITPELDPKNKQALRVAFLYQTGDYQTAKEELNYLERLFNFKGPLEVEQLKNIIALQTQNKEASLESSSRACRRHDGINCWVSLQEMTWDNFGEKIQDEEDLVSSTDFDLDQLKRAGGFEPIQETPIINQRDIEEMDGEQVQLVPEEFY